MHTRLRKVITNRRGATATEYGLVAAGVALAIAAAVFTLGDDLGELLGGVPDSLDSDAGDAASSGPIGIDALISSMEGMGANSVRTQLDLATGHPDTSLRRLHARFAALAETRDTPWLRDMVRILDEALAIRGLDPLPPD